MKKNLSGAMIFGDFAVYRNPDGISLRCYKGSYTQISDEDMSKLFAMFAEMVYKAKKEISND